MAMRTFFQSWRRKLGCVTLVMALAVTGMWMRSRVYGDFLTLKTVGSSSQFLGSFQGDLKWIKSVDSSGAVSQAPPYRFSMEERFPGNESFMPLFGGSLEAEWIWRWEQVGFLVGDANLSGYVVSVVQIPYWSVAMPLTFVSAFLIIWPGRKQA